MNKEKTEKLLEEIKRLMILQLSKANVSNEDIGSALSVSYKTIERMFPKINKKKVGKKKKISK
ncbi:MAG: helix-turn-helix domain-containing protein [bacterium]|nr:helix-turn-helix domain-containing protein [bacterium]